MSESESPQAAGGRATGGIARPRHDTRAKQAAGVTFDSKIYITCTETQKAAIQAIASARSQTVSALVRGWIEGAHS